MCQRSGELIGSFQSYEAERSAVTAQAGLIGITTHTGGVLTTAECPPAVWRVGIVITENSCVVNGCQGGIGGGCAEVAVFLKSGGRVDGKCYRAWVRALGERSASNCEEGERDWYDVAAHDQQ